MKPKQIVVFDGLRITTVHLDHLQGAFLTGLRDLREAVGLGTVQRGFQVHADRADQVVVAPGLAFDRDGNRIVSDEPQTIDVVFPGGDRSLWVTVAYDQSETDETEGKNTLVWDGCALDVQAEQPGPADPAIAIARLERQDDGALAVHPAGTEPAPAHPVGGNGDVPPPDGRSPAPAGESNQPAPPAELPGTSTASNGATGRASTMGQLAVGQGVVRLSGLAGAHRGALTSLAAAVRNQSADGGESVPSVTLATADVDVSFRPLSLSCQSVLTATATVGENEPGMTSGLPALHAVAWGEVSQAGETILQHSLINCGSAPSPFTACVAEGAVAQLPLAGWAESVPRADTAAAGLASEASPAMPPELAVCRQLQVSVRFQRNEMGGLWFVVTVDWKGSQDEESIRLLESGTYRLQIDAHVAWKALGSAV
jgi:hypothetical protein